MAFNRFISRYSNRLRLFFKSLKGVDIKGWRLECEETFWAIKKYIVSPMSLSQSVDGEELYLYLSSSVTAVSVALMRLDFDKRQILVYFVSKALSEVEIRYSDFERVALALRMAAKKLQPYFQAHTIVMLTSLSIRSILHKPNALRRFLKWAVELSEFDIEYRPRTTIKGQAPTDFVLERYKVHS